MWDLTNAGVFKVKKYADGKYEGYFGEYYSDGEYYEGFSGKGNILIIMEIIQMVNGLMGNLVKGTVKWTYDNGNIYFWEK